MDILNLRTNKYNNNTYKIILNVKQTKKNSSTPGRE